jgi:hypothetical protein
MRFGGSAFRRERGGGLGSWCRGHAYLSDPDKHPVVLIARHAFGIDELILQCGERLIVELEPEPQGSVRHPPLSLEQLADLG